MNTEKKELRVDRIEEGLVIAYDANGNEYCMCERIADIQESDILLADVNKDEQVVAVEVQREKMAVQTKTLTNRLKKLFDKKGEIE